MKILEELYCGGTISHESAGQPSAQHKKLRELVTTNIQRMLAMITEAQKE